MEVKNSKPLSQQAVDDYERNFNVVSWIQGESNQVVTKINENMKFPYCIGMMNVNGGINISMMIRQAVIYGCQEIFLFGRKRYDRRGAVGADHYVKITHVPFEDTADTKLFIKTIKDNHLIPIFVEQGGTLIDQIPWGVLGSKIKKSTNGARYCFIFGNEGTGINKDILALAKEIPNSFVLSLPQHSLLRSLNVAMACAIVLHEFYSQVIYKQTIGKYTDF
jgi:tRNA G18 (ribose-2'-O)-methylase SpoU